MKVNSDLNNFIWGNSRNGIQTGMVWQVNERWGNLAMNEIDMGMVWGACKVKGKHGLALW